MTFSNKKHISLESQWFKIPKMVSFLNNKDFIIFVNLIPQDGVYVQNIGEKGENPCRWSKISLHKNFELILEQNVNEQTYLEISCRSQKFWV